MARKSTKKTETEKKVTKKATKKVEVPAAEDPKDTFLVKDIIEWSDEECEAKAEDFKFSVTDVRNILKTLVDRDEQLRNVTEKLNIVKTALQKGFMTGYQVTCPHCKRNYIVGSSELNRDSNIMCKVCGTEYKENENITGVSMTGEDGIVETI